MDYGGVFVKYVLFIFNILFVICGVLLIAFGSLMLTDIGRISSFSQTYSVNSIPIAVLVLGCVIFIISVLGCWGAISENRKAILTYSLFMFILLLCQLTLIVYVWRNRDHFLQTMDKVVDEIWEQRKTSQEVLNGLQLSLKCCGSHGYQDYEKQGAKLPVSCCEFAYSPCDKEHVWHKGCTQALHEFMALNTNLIRYAGMGVAAVQLVAFSFAVCLSNQMREVYGRHY